MNIAYFQACTEASVANNMLLPFPRRIHTLWPRSFQWWTIGLGVILLTNLIILSSVPLLVKTYAVLVLTNLLPGTLWVAWLVGQSDEPPSWWEQSLYTVGAGYGSMVIPMLAISYLPGGVTRDQTLLIFDFLLVGLLALNHRQFVQRAWPVFILPAEKRSVSAFLRGLIFERRWLLVGLISLALTGGFFRFTHLGYSEFQGDEARVTLYASQVIEGYENELLIHRKGPAEILAPTAIYALTERLTETTARLPFALANFTALFALFLLGWRLFGPVAGWAAAMLLALDGYLISFARIAQYQSIVLLMAVLSVLLFDRLARHPKALTRYFTLGALFLTTGLLAHYEAALIIIPVVYLLWRIWRQGILAGQLVRALLVPAIGSGLVLASFYVPFVRTSDFRQTYSYIAGKRIGLGEVYNNLVDFFDRTTLYSSSYYVLTLISLAVIGLLQLYWHNLSGLLRWLAVGVVIAGLALTFRSATWLTVGHIDFTWVFFAVLLLAAWLMPNYSAEERMVWLWFGAPLLVALFFTAVPNTHVYNFFMAWGLLAGKVIADGWQWIAKRFPLRLAQVTAISVALAATLVFGFYEYWYFVDHDVEVLRTWPVNRPWGYWVTYNMPVDVAVFGFPLKNGWKAVAGLYAAGILQGNYATNATDTVAKWYTRGANNCSRDAPNYYILVNRAEPTRAEETAKLRKQLEADHDLFGTVLVHNQPRLEIYKAGKTGLTPQQFPLKPYAARFNRRLADPDLEANGPVGQPVIQHPLNIRLGNSIWLKGYTLYQTVTKPRDTLPLTLYWQTTQPLNEDYMVFVQLIDLKDLHKAGQRDGQPGCDQYPTTTWLPGDIIADPYTIPIEPNARTGEYTLLIGLYTNAERLPVYTANGHAQGNQVELTKVRVTR